MILQVMKELESLPSSSPNESALPSILEPEVSEALSWMLMVNEIKKNCTKILAVDTPKDLLEVTDSNKFSIEASPSECDLFILLCNFIDVLFYYSYISLLYLKIVFK